MARAKSPSGNKTGTDNRVRRLPVMSIKPSAKPTRVPRGKLEMIVTLLEMTKPPTRRAPHRSGKLTLLRSENITASFYRYLYNAVGGPWLWYERRLLSDEQLLDIVRDPKVEVYVLYVAGVPAGYVELDRRQRDEVELAFFGLTPEFVSQRLGPYLLAWAVEQAWSKRVRRVWVHTCNLDHPSAIAVYQRAGFSPYHQERSFISDPRRRGGMPKGQEFL